MCTNQQMLYSYFGAYIIHILVKTYWVCGWPKLVNYICIKSFLQLISNYILNGVKIITFKKAFKCITVTLITIPTVRWCAPLTFPLKMYLKKKCHLKIKQAHGAVVGSCDWSNQDKTIRASCYDWLEGTPLWSLLTSRMCGIQCELKLNAAKGLNYKCLTGTTQIYRGREFHIQAFGCSIASS